MTPFTLDQWVILLLVLLLGIVLGMYLFAGGKWKRRYRDEVALREKTDAENHRLHHEVRETERLRDAAAQRPVDRPVVTDRNDPRPL